MPLYEIAITGQVQGVGFRPFICELAQRHGISGHVQNNGEGVSIYILADQADLENFVQDIRLQHPQQARIDHLSIKEVPETNLSQGFHILPSEKCLDISACLPPDVAMCGPCRNELHDPFNRRFQYPFISCLNCGPRASVIRELPYDREFTTMSNLQMCPHCSSEYHETGNRRQHSQTNSCMECPIPIKLFDSQGQLLEAGGANWLSIALSTLRKGGLVVLKGIGGFHLLADATSPSSIQSLRKKKQRPRKPFAVLYADLETATQDVLIREWEQEALLSPEAPIVLCKIRKPSASKTPIEDIAPGLDQLGVILPYTPMLDLLANEWQQPLILTSANRSGSAILFKDEMALQELQGLADLIICNEREIVMPLEDSVIQFTSSGEPIFLRKGRGYPLNKHLLAGLDSSILATGADLKASFILSAKNVGIISPYLGDLSDYSAQEQYEGTLDHISQLYNFKPKLIVSDAHPGYVSSIMGKEMAIKHGCDQFLVQHHQAHFAAVLEEHQLWDEEEPVLGVIWDGTGYGSDGQIWGGAFFVLEKKQMKRSCHLEDFPVLSGDKMSLEPRLSALSVLHQAGLSTQRLKNSFSDAEWKIHQQQLQEKSILNTSSMGRLMDAVSAILDIGLLNSYEGEAAMLLESKARDFNGYPNHRYDFPISGSKIIWQVAIRQVIDEIDKGLDSSEIAFRFHDSLAGLIIMVAEHYGIQKLAFSGGVFQNALLCERITAHASGRYATYFHQQLPPNDACIAFGQMAYFRKVGDD